MLKGVLSDAVARRSAARASPPTWNTRPNAPSTGSTTRKPASACFTTSSPCSTIPHFERYMTGLAPGLHRGPGHGLAHRARLLRHDLRAQPRHPVAHALASGPVLLGVRRAARRSASGPRLIPWPPGTELELVQRLPPLGAPARPTPVRRRPARRRDRRRRRGVPSPSPISPVPMPASTT